MTSLNAMVKQASGLIDTVYVSEWENTFLLSLTERTSDGDNTTSMTEKQVEKLEQIYNKHFINAESKG